MSASPPRPSSASPGVRPLAGRTCLVVDRRAEARRELAIVIAEAGARTRATTDAPEEVLAIVALMRVDLLIWAVDDAATVAPAMEELRVRRSVGHPTPRAIAIVRSSETPVGALKQLFRLFDEILERPASTAEVPDRVAALLGP